MEPRQALQILDQIAAAFTGNRQDHQNIQIALATLAILVNKEEDAKKAAELKSAQQETGDTPPAAQTTEQTAAEDASADLAEE